MVSGSNGSNSSNGVSSGSFSFSKGGAVVGQW